MTARDRTPLLILAGLLVLHFHDTWLTGFGYFGRDLTYFFQPRFTFSTQFVQAGHVPLWNPFSSAGAPWQADPQSALFYPGTLLFYLFPFAGALKLFHALHFFVTGLGGYLLARRGGRGVALLSAVLWSMNGFWSARVEFVNTLGTLAWLPFLALTARRPVLLALTATLAFLAGYLPFVAWEAALLLAWAATARGPAVWKQGAKAAVLAVFLAALQLLPTAQLVALSDRAREGMTWEVASQYGLRLKDLAGLLAPWWGAWRDGRFPGEKFLAMTAFYIGLGGAVAALLAARALTARARIVWALVFASGAATAAGPLFKALYGAGLFQGVRYPGQFALFMTAAALFALAQGARGVPRRAVALLTALAAAELLFYGFHRQPTMGEKFFHERPGWIEPLQADPEGGRLFLTPRAALHQSGDGKTATEAWRDLRRRLYSVTGLPYRLRDVNVHGTILIPGSGVEALRAPYRAGSAAEALPSLRRLGVRWIAAPEPLAHEGLVPRAAAPWKLYELKDPPPAARMGGAPWSLRRPTMERMVFSGPPAAAPAGLVTVEKAYPGWRALARGRDRPVRRRRSVADDGGFIAVAALAGDDDVLLLFRPWTWRAGLAISVLSWMGLAAAGLLRLKKFL